ncbi:hypothetical protein S40288_08330 [Stachybotrys chartarum IBT 40288]|nr:hypothetical protein S40288_08330 [Stachybotrys chartarum IBT 40288]
MNGRHLSDSVFSRRASTIRTVPSSDGVASSSPENKQSPISNSAVSDLGAMATMAPLPQEPDHITAPSSMRSLRGSVNQYATKWNASGVRAVDPLPAQSSPVLPDVLEQDEWDSTVGKAGLGKTGRVINKLVSDNDSLKRDIKIERLLADEAKQAAKLLEDKMERMASEYESRLLEANVTKTLLARKERQVETLNAMVQAEKKRAEAAEARERTWKQEMERTRAESNDQIDEAIAQAMMMEGRYNAISSHWRDQGNHVKGAIAEVRTEVTDLVEERRKDDEKIQTLRELCEQQDSNIKQLTSEKQQLVKLFEQYKLTQEEALRDIKETALRQKEEQDRILKESKEALDKLKWALNVKAIVKDAQ